MRPDDRDIALHSHGIAEMVDDIDSRPVHFHFFHPFAAVVAIDVRRAMDRSVRKVLRRPDHRHISGNRDRRTEIRARREIGGNDFLLLHPDRAVPSPDVDRFVAADDQNIAIGREGPSEPAMISRIDPRAGVNLTGLPNGLFREPKASENYDQDCPCVPWHLLAPS